MSNTLAIATTTATLQQLLQSNINQDPNLPGAQVNILRPKTPTSDDTAEIGLYLYMSKTNTAYRNMDLPTRDAQGRLISQPITGLDLYYLLTFYGKESELEPQKLMGNVVRTLTDEPILTRERIQAVVEANPNMISSNLAEQIEIIKIAPLSYSLEELSKIWSIFFQVPYSLSLAYQTSVTVINSEQPIITAKPVESRYIDVTRLKDLTAPAGVELRNFTLNGNVVYGEVIINKAEKEIGVEYYSLYWGKDNKQKTSSSALLTKVPVTGQDITYNIPENTVKPNQAKYILAYGGNEQRELLGASTKLPSATVEVSVKSLFDIEPDIPTPFAQALVVSDFTSFIDAWNGRGRPEFAPVRDMTLAAWVNFDAIQTSQRLNGIFSFAQDNGNFERGWALGIRPSPEGLPEGKQVMVYLATENPVGNSPGNYFTSFDSVLQTGSWYHVAVTYNGDPNVSEVKFYINGQLVRTSNGVSGDILYTEESYQYSTFFTLGRYRDANESLMMRGELADIQVWRRPLSDLEVATIATPHGDQLQGDEEGLAVYFPLRKETGNVVHDLVTGLEGTTLGLLRYTGTGIAITDLTSANGLWEYSIDGENTWIEFPNLNSGQAVLLDAGSQLRFLNNSEFRVNLNVQFYYWDLAEGDIGEVIDDVTTHQGIDTSRLVTRSLT